MKPLKRTDGAGIGMMIVVLLFILVRLPTALLSPGGQDEEWYGIPGLTIANEGIPRVPYARATDPDSVFIGADEMLFAQPPLSFYAQAPFFEIFAGNYGTARLSSLVAAIVSIVLTFGIAEAFFQDRRLAILAAAIYSCSRLCFFPAMVARPDMLCGMLGLLAVYCGAISRQQYQTRWIIAAGISVGLAALSHPFAIVFGIQMTIWIAWNAENLIGIVRRVAVFAISVTATFATWTPLILMRPDLFRSQFVGNILRPAGPGLLSRFVMPWDSFSHQTPQLIDRAHPIQFSMLLFGLIAISFLAWNKRDRAATTITVLGISSVYLLTACLGDHPVQGFWCYSASLGWIAFAYVARQFDIAVIRGRANKTSLRTFAAAILLAAMLPGSGGRAVMTYATKFGDDVYASPRFVRNILDDLPADATLTVGPEFSLPAYAAGRDVILACRHPMYFDSAEIPTDYYIFGRRDFAEDMVAAYACELVRNYGNHDDVFANYAEVYRRSPEATAAPATASASASP
ncbi:ArnT family glycosyltransferase [Rubripirellula reticaptiva]|uniref:Dolichyl-phosphate-mannose-protein mannosyltransferase n=1 Tax=Rubripirellula reticaptiva TaxID=2528013 RepID=A0A5C6FB29_9BACT|nr:glycosyltransferase family 39 protein [Rubripirellula reticaptiva]TWU57982.1 Dolichyl-phosphate-mannose-protein mannosyltransferase [Rubripirellula reticaptiva]